MKPIDVHELALNLSDIIGGLDSHRTRGPLLVTRDGQPEAVIIRNEAYAPRLHDFAFVGGGILCHRCPDGPFGPGRIPCDTSSLGVALKAANQHWRDTHRETKP